MRILTAILALCFAINAQGALTVTARGTPSTNSAGTTFTCTPTTTIAAGSLGVLLVVTDNATGGGATPMFTDATVNDSAGNTWTRRQNVVYDPGANNAGTAIAIFTAPISTALVGSVGSVTLNLAASTTPKVGAFWQISGATGQAYVTSGVKCSGCTSGQTGTAVQLTTGSITNGDAVVCFVGAEGSSAITADSDTTNGSWNTQQTVSAGTTTTGQHIGSQVKIVTATATQSYDVTLGTSEDWNAAWVQVQEVTTSVKNVMDLANASVKTINDLARASVKSIVDLP